MPSNKMPNEMAVGSYLAQRLKELGCNQAFGVPGDYVLGICDLLIEGGVQWVGCSNELNAGYAADGYARVNGIGCACVTYGVGALSLMNACAGAHAENVPVVIICGSPKTSAYDPRSPIKLHHTIPGDLHAEQRAFAGFTAAAPLIDNLETAAEMIDEALTTCIRLSKPVYLEIPLHDVAMAACPGAGERLARSPTSSWPLVQPHDDEAGAAAVRAAVEMVAHASRPAILVGAEVCRVDAQPAVRRLAGMLRVPVATTRHGKSAVEEGGTICAGVYQGKLSRTVVKEYIEGADVLLKIGSLHTDFDYLSAQCGEGQATVSTNLCGVSLTHASQPETEATWFKPVAIVPFVNALCDALRERHGDAAREDEARDKPTKHTEPKDKAEGCSAWGGARAAAVAALEHQLAFDAEKPSSPSEALTANGFLHAVGRWLHNQPLPVTLLADTGDALIAAGDMPLRPVDMFLSQAFYASIGYTVPAAVGVALAHRNALEHKPPKHHVVPGDDEQGPRRVVTLVGDGAFQMTAQAVATSIANKLPITYVILNNRGDSIERAIHEGPSYNNYNDIPEWRYSSLLHAFGQPPGEGFSAAAQTVGELDAALTRADESRFRHATNLIEVRVAREDLSDALVQFGQFLKAKAGLK
ncbi:hypothetical protein KFE25_013825 [Diacronema lutheri]|uniref:pyruvate decarboxylase n=1 Tax=Diacronema lutheri TaxID=2081491 RepID=A0A8J6CBH4_DIALT|nr:hypothetical protein KFE25_013825 [Diacronema lutheri]